MYRINRYNCRRGWTVQTKRRMSERRGLHAEIKLATKTVTTNSLCLLLLCDSVSIAQITQNPLSTEI